MTDFKGENRRVDDGKLWQAIEELRRGQAVREQKLETFEKYQSERNHDILNEVSKVDAKVELLRLDIRANHEKDEAFNSSLMKKGVWVLGLMVTSLVAYIWKFKVGH